MQPHVLEAAPDPVALRDQALNLRESVNSSRARMRAHREQMERLRAQLAELRALLEQPAPAAPPAAAPEPAAAAAPAPLPSPVLKETAADSAPAAVSFKPDAPLLSWKAAPYALIFLAGVGMQMVPGSRREAAAKAVPAPVPVAAPVASEPSPEPILDDGGADEALTMAHDWRLPGDERPLAERLGSGTNPPGSQPEWSAERTGERLYRVSFRPSGSDLGYEFDVDLASRRVDPTPETAELISPRLAARR